MSSHYAGVEAAVLSRKSLVQFARGDLRMRSPRRALLHLLFAERGKKFTEIEKKACPVLNSIHDAARTAGPDN